MDDHKTLLICLNTHTPICYSFLTNSIYYLFKHGINATKPIYNFYPTSNTIDIMNELNIYLLYYSRLTFQLNNFILS